jgi:hypothetical protein
MAASCRTEPSRAATKVRFRSSLPSLHSGFDKLPYYPKLVDVFSELGDFVYGVAVVFVDIVQPPSDGERAAENTDNGSSDTEWIHITILTFERTNLRQGNRAR